MRIRESDRAGRAPAGVRYTDVMDQHTGTRAYLEAFVDPVTPSLHDPSVWVARLRAGTVKRRAPHNVAVEVDYYSRKLPSGEVVDRFEQMLSGLESDAAPVLRMIRSGEFTLTEPIGRASRSSSASSARASCAPTLSGLTTSSGASWTAA